MSGSASQGLEQQLLQHTLAITPMAALTRVYVALCGSAPSEDTGGTEVSGGGYARVAATFSLLSATGAANAAAIEFPAATTSWGAVGYFEIWSAATGGDRLYWGPLVDPADGTMPLLLTVAAGDIVRFPVGMLLVQVAEQPELTTGGPFLPLTGGEVSGATTFGSTLAFGANQSIGTFTGNLTTPTLTLTGSGPSIGLQINTKGAGIVNVKALNIADPANGQGFSTNNSLQVHNDPNYTGGAGHTAFAVLQNASGSLGAGVWYSNLFNVADNVAVGVSGDGSAAYTHQTNLTLNTGFRGSRFATGASMTISGTSGNLNTDTASYYVASQGQATANVNDNGVPGTPHGNLFGSFFQANLLSGATNWYQVSGEEVDVGIAAGSSAAYLSGHAVVLLYNHAVATPNASHAYAVGRQQGATVGWDIGIAFGGPQGWFPIAPTGSIITAKPTILGGTPPAMACAFGIDLSLVTFSTAFLKSQGFTVDGAGNVTAASLQCGTTTGPTWTTGTAAPTSTQPVGSLYSRVGGAVGATLYVSRGGGTWAAVAGV